MQGYIQTSGHLGLTVSCLSYADYFTINCVTDEAVMKEPSFLVKHIEENLKKCIKTYQYDDASASEAPTPRRGFV